jgi:SRSO17 transposase
MQWNAKHGRRSTQRFKAFMVPLVAPLGRSEPRAAATSYAQALLMPGQRKSIEPMAARLGVPSQRLHQFVTDTPAGMDTTSGGDPPPGAAAPEAPRSLDRRL